MATTSPRSSESSWAAEDAFDPDASVDEEGQLHLGDYLQVVLARRWFLIAFFVITVGVVAVHTYTQVPIFKASALILIEPKKIDVVNVKELYDPAGGQAAEYLKTQYQVLSSRRVAEPVLEELGLSEIYGLKSFMASIVVKPVKDTRLVQVGFLSSDPVEAARVADALVASYIRDTRQRSLGISDAGLRDLRERAKELRVKVEEASAALERFKREHRLVSNDESHEVIAARLSVLNAEMARAQTARIQAQSELEALREAGDELEEAPDLDEELYRAQRREIAALEAELQSMSLRLKPDHPIRAAHEARIAAAREELERLRVQRVAEAAARRDAERARQVALAESRLRAAERAEAALKVEIDALTGQLLETERFRGEYRLLLQAHETVNNTYRSVIQRIEEVELAAATETKDSTVFVIDPAEVPTHPVSPNKRRSLGMAVIFGLAGGIALCFLVDYLDRSLKTKEDVERVLRLPVLGVAPPAEDAAADGGDAVEVLAAKDPRSHVAEAFRTIRTGVSFGVMGRQGERTRKLVVTSALPGDGKTLVSTNLAIALAQLGKRVLLVDADLRKPRLTGLLSLEGVGPGLSTILAGDEELERLDAAPRPVLECETLFVLPSGPIPPNPADLLNGDRMGALLQALEGRFDWVIFDAPPAAVADPTILSTQVVSVLFVVRSFRTPRELAKRACSGMAAVGARVIGVVLNHVDLPVGRGGGYGYGYDYGTYYGRDEGPAKVKVTTRVLRKLGMSRSSDEPSSKQSADV